MNCIVELPASQSTEWSPRDRTVLVERELKLHLAGGNLSYEVIAVEPYEKVYPPWQKMSPESVSLVVKVGDRVAAELDLSNGWNGYAHIENLIVAQEFRRQGLARALVERAAAWAESKNLTGVMLETQSNNVPACQLYESCGFSLEGFDSSLYRGLNLHSQEVALFWYRQASQWLAP